MTVDYLVTDATPRDAAEINASLGRSVGQYCRPHLRIGRLATGPRPAGGQISCDSLVRSVRRSPLSDHIAASSIPPLLSSNSPCTSVSALRTRAKLSNQTVFLFRFLRPSEFQTKLCKYVRFVWNVFFLSYSANSIQCSSLTRFGLNTWLVWTTFTVSRQKAVWFDVTHCRLAGGLPRCSVLVSPLSEIYAPALTAFAARPFDGNHRQSVRLQSRRALILWL